MAQNEFIIVKNALVGRRKKNPDQKWVRVGDGDDAYFATTLDDNIAGMKGQDLSLEIKHVYKDGRMYHNIMSWHVADELDHATRPEGNGAAFRQAKPESAPSRDTMILMQSSMKQAAECPDLAMSQWPWVAGVLAYYQIEAARLVEAGDIKTLERLAAGKAPEALRQSPPPVTDAEAEQELARQHAQQQQLDDDIPF